jgi:hypothetical protein
VVVVKDLRVARGGLAILLLCGNRFELNIKVIELNLRRILANSLFLHERGYLRERKPQLEGQDRSV